MASKDSETGEVMQLKSLFDCGLDMETGEIIGQTATDEVETKQNGIRKPKFSVPKAYLVQHNSAEKPKDRCCLKPCETYTLTSKQKVLELKEEIILGYNRTSHRLFLIPSLFFFPRFAAIFLVIAEIWLHVWSHKKNKRNENNNIYYRSPLDSLTSQFCSLCLETKEFPSHDDRYMRKHKKTVSSSLQ